MERRVEGGGGNVVREVRDVRRGGTERGGREKGGRVVWRGRGSVEQGGGHVERKGKIKGKRWYGEEGEEKEEGGEG